MDNIFAVYDELRAQGVSLYDYDIGFAKAATIELHGRHAIFLDSAQCATAAEARHALLHEGGHAMTGATHALYSPLERIERNEARANRWAYRRWMPCAELRRAIAQGCTEIWQLAEYFSITEDFVRGALAYYQDACGVDFNGGG